MADTARPPQPEWPVLVAGLGHVGVAVVHRLQALGVPVRALLTPAEMSRQAAELQALGVEIVTASAAWENDLGRQDFSRLGAVVLAADNDSSNVDACLLVRRASPKGSMGKVFGFVFSGQSIGLALAPLLFGFMIDSGVPAWIFFGSALFTVLCMIVVLISAKYSR